MGFFSDLKEDVSQAATELMGNEQKEAKDGQAAETVKEEKTEGFDLNAVLEKAEESAGRTSEPEEKKVKTTDETAVITEGMTIIGDVTTSGNMELMGGITGNIAVGGKLNIFGSIEGDSKAAEVYCEGAKITGEVNSLGSVKVGKETVIIGNIYASSAVLAGAVKGDIDVKGPVILDASAIVMGNIKSKSLQINNGAVVEGICSQCYADVSPTSFFDKLNQKKNK